MKRKARFALFVIVSALLSLVLGVAAGLATDAPPKFTDSQKLNIRNAQLEVQNIVLQMDQLERQYRELNDRKQAAAQKVSGAISAAFKDAKLSEEDYTLDGDLNLIAKPPKPDAVPAKEKK